MRKFVSLFSVLMLFYALAFGQTRTVIGQVRDEKGNAIPNATVSEAGSNNAVKADVNGNFSIRLKEGGQITISAVGYDRRTMTPLAGNQVIALATRSDQVQETVVVTALGIKRRPRELGYSQSTVNNATITNGRATNLGAALSGKVAGLTIVNTSASVNASPRITLRGNRSLLGNNEALIVLDGVPVPQNTISYLNPNDVESVTVLKGGQAATLYGADGVNGVLVITTRKGTGKPQVSFSHTSNVEDVAYLPKFQKTYGSGSGYGATQEENYRPFENQQFGDRYDGSIRAIGRRAPDGSYLEVPYSYNPKTRDLWDKGYTMQNDVSVSGGDASGSSFYLSFQDVYTKGIVPKDTYRRDALRFNAKKVYGKFSAGFDGSYTTDRAKRTTADFYWFALNTPSWAPLNKLKDWKNNYFASPNGYFNDYYNNPWYELDNNRSDNRNNYFNGNINLNFKPVSWLDFTYRLGTAVTNFFGKSYTNRYDYSEYAKGRLAVGNRPITKDPQYNDYSYNWRARNAPIVGSVADASSLGNRINSDLIITFDKDWNKDFSTKLIIGNNLQQRRSQTVNTNVSSLALPDLYNVGNRASDFGGSANESNLRKVGNFADLTLGFRDFLFLHGSARHDMYSVFYSPTRDKSLYSKLYPGVDVSLIVTDAISALKSDVMGYLKLRAGYNINANDNASPYGLATKYSLGSGFPYGANIGTTVGNNYSDSLLTFETTKTTELGLEATFWKNRINLDATIYRQNAENQVLPVSITSATGFTQYTVNTANVENKGAEIELRANIWKNKDWNIDLNGNYTYNTNKVTSLFGAFADFKTVEINNNGSAGNAHIYAEIGKTFPFLKTTAWLRDDQGHIVIDENDGWPVRDPALRDQGSTLPKHQLGLGARISWRFLTLAGNAEYRGGNYVYHDIGEDMAFTGSGKITTVYDRQQFIWPNSVYFDGTKYVPNTSIPVENYIAIYEGWGDGGFSRGLSGTGEVFASSGAFWKIRDLSLSLNVPGNLLNRLKVVKGATLSVFGRNLFTWLPKDNWYTDPEFSNTNGNGIGLNTSFNTPPVRQYGATINVNF